MKRTGLARLLAVSAVVGLVLAACSSGSGASPSVASKGTVKIAINEWVGAEANVAVVKNLLEGLGYTVETPTLAEEVAWQGFDTGEVDVILENWGHPDLEKLYFEDKKVAQDAGANGVTGIIGWYVPEWMVTEYPDITNWENLNKYAEMFKTSESGDKGQFLGTDPSYVQYDEALVTNLGLNFKVIFTGSENATIEAIKQSVAQKKPLLFYWWDPHWLNSTVELARIALPAYTAGCDADKEKVACDYPETPLNKIISVKFNTSGGAAATLIKNFKWTNADQNSVANDITNNGMTAEQAAKKWVDANEAVWKAWVP